jgi:hypothetical protein
MDPGSIGEEIAIAILVDAAASGRDSCLTAQQTFLRVDALQVQGSVLQEDAVSIRVFEGHALAVPIGIEGRHGTEPGGPQAAVNRVEAVALRQLKDKQIVLGRRPARDVPMCDGELQMIRRTGGWPSMTPSILPCPLNS